MHLDAIDAVIAAALLLGAVAGAIGGALPQLVKLAAAVAGWLAARHGVPRLVAALGPRAALVPGWARAVVAFAVVALAVGLLGRWLVARIRGPDGAPARGERLLGALLGAAKVGLVAWVLLSALALAGGPIAVGRLRLDLRGSRLAALAARHDLLALAAPAEARRLGRLLHALRDPAARERLLREDPELGRILADPRLRGALERAGLAPGAAGEPGDALRRSPELRSLLRGDGDQGAP